MADYDKLFKVCIARPDLVVGGGGSRAGCVLEVRRSGGGRRFFQASKSNPHVLGRTLALPLNSQVVGSRVSNFVFAAARKGSAEIG